MSTYDKGYLDGLKAADKEVQRAREEGVTDMRQVSHWIKFQMRPVEEKIKVNS